jgi:nucleotide-binding universal stress UspA family protein
VYTKIIVPLDGSPIAESILPYVRTIVRASNTPVELLHVITPVVIDAFCDPERPYYIDDVKADMTRHALSYLRPIAASLPEPSSVECEVRVGEPADVIVDEAKPGTIVVMATHGRSGAQRWLLGSVADEVLHGIRTHLLLARTGYQNDSKQAVLKTIVVPLDGSPMAEKILPTVAALAKLMSLTVVLMRVYSVANTFYATDEYVPNVAKFVERVKREASSYLVKMAEDLKQRGVRQISCLLAEGDGAAEIIEFARRTPENLIAMSTRGRSGMRRILGSVTDRVVRYSWDPVLVIPPALTASESAASMATPAGSDPPTS